MRIFICIFSIQSASTIESRAFKHLSCETISNGYETVYRRIFSSRGEMPTIFCVKISKRGECSSVVSPSCCDLDARSESTAMPATNRFLYRRCDATRHDRSRSYAWVHLFGCRSGGPAVTVQRMHRTDRHFRRVTARVQRLT